MSDKSNDAFCHAPLPYTVTLRVSLDADSPPTVIEKDVTAYSLIEAVLTAQMEATGMLPKDAKTVIEKITPNVGKWMELAASGALRRKRDAR